jgi:tight adherence protein C
VNAYAADWLIPLLLTVAVVAASFVLSRSLVEVIRQWLSSRVSAQPERQIPRAYRYAIVLSLPLANLLGPLLPLSFREQLQRKLRAADLDEWLLPHQFVAAALTYSAGFAVLAALAGLSLPKAGAVGLLGLGMAWMFLNDAMRRRHDEILRELPGYLDMLTLALEAGGALSAALRLTTERARDSALRRAFLRAQGDLRAGRSRADALRALSDRLDSPAITALVAALIQADSSGGSLAAVLRSQSAQRLDERFTRAEKAAMEAPVKMLGPLVLCIFPCTFIVLAFPILLRVLGQPA